MSATNEDPASRVVEDDQAMLIDRYLPTYDATRVESRVAAADVGATWAAALDLDLLAVKTPLTAAAFWLRGLPEQIARLAGKQAGPADVPPRLSLGDMERGLPGWVGLGQRPSHEVAFGAVGRFWTPEIVWEDVPAEAFAEWSRPGTATIVANLSLRHYGLHRTLVTYEARTRAHDAESRRRFLRYWRLISPFVGHLMRAVLRDIAVSAEQGQRPA